MARMSHGENVSLEKVTETLQHIREVTNGLGLASAPLRVTWPTAYGYLFPKLQEDPNALLPEGPATVKHLEELALTMRELSAAPAADSSIPAAYTYFGQFVNHDISLEFLSDTIASLDPDKVRPIRPHVLREKLQNGRSPTLDLDTVYGSTSDGSPTPRVCDVLAIAPVSKANPPEQTRPRGRDTLNDLPRRPLAPGAGKADREALIGDARNDENFIISQLHVAFLRAHRRLANDGLTFRAARKLLTEHYQWLIIHDFLNRVADGEIVRDILAHGNRFFRPERCGLFMPLEFSAAAFRFGHSMVRRSYHYNDNFRGETAATLTQLFTPAAFRTTLAASEQLPENWIIQWEYFLDSGKDGFVNSARSIDTRIVEPLFELADETGAPFKGVRASLAARNLLRGYMLRLPVGQSVARALGIDPLKPEEIEAIALGTKAENEDEAARNARERQASVLREAKFLDRTPLWYYILAEAAAGGGFVLGPVGSTIVAEVLIGMVRQTEDSILSQPGWRPTLGTRPGFFTLEDFFRFSGVWG